MRAAPAGGNVFRQICRTAPELSIKLTETILACRLPQRRTPSPTQKLPPRGSRGFYCLSVRYARVGHATGKGARP
jgi:hypothetical protein